MQGAMVKKHCNRKRKNCGNQFTNKGNPKPKKTINNDASVRRSVVLEEDIMTTVSSKNLLDVTATNVEGFRIIGILSETF